MPSKINFCCCCKVYMATAIRHWFACGDWVNNWEACHTILSKQPQKRTDEEITKLASWVRPRIPILQELNREAVKVYAGQVVLERHTKDTTVYLQGEEIDRFYCVLRGSVSLLVDPLSTNNAVPAAQGTNSKVTLDEHKLKSRYKKVHVLTAGDYFGHQVCLHWNKSAIFTAAADEYTELLAIGGKVFTNVLSGVFKVRLFETASLLTRVHTLMLWGPSQLATLCLSLTHRRLTMGEYIFCQGMPANKIYFIKSGSVQLLLNTLQPIPEAILLRLQPPRDYVIVMFERETNSPQRLQSSNKPHKSIKRSLSSEKSTSDSSLSSAQHAATFAQKYRLHAPLRSLPLCVLPAGESLTGIEHLCGLKEHLFTAVCNSEVELYQISLPQFDHLFQKYGTSTAALEKLECFIEQISIWKEKYPDINLFDPLHRLLKQQLQICQKSASKRRQTWRSSEELVEHLLDSLVRRETSFS